ncbi:MAG: MotA/TolQ/ExbB proton channel family protein [Planctomycetales bacterium]
MTCRRRCAGTRSLAAAACLGLGMAGFAAAQETPPEGGVANAPRDAAAAAEGRAEGPLDLGELFRAGGTIGIVILVLSLAMVALIVEHVISIRRGALVPEETAAGVHELVQQRQFAAAEQLCREHPSFLAYVLAAGLREAGAGYGSVEKAMEDANAAQAARLFRKIEYLSVIGTLAPMLGLLGTVWGMIIAFHEFQTTANPQVSELAPGIYRALVTTLLGLGVAVPALAAFAWFRNRIDELVADGTAVAEHVFFDYKCAQLAARRTRRGGEADRAAAVPARTPAPREKTG